MRQFRVMPRPAAYRWLARGLAAVGSLALLGTILAGTAQAAYPGSNGLIAFVRGSNVYTIKSSGAASSLKRLTGGGRNAGPRWSPGGKQIAYLDDGNLWVMNANGSHKRRLTDAAPKYTDSRPSWSPNGKYLAFVRTEHGHSYGDLMRYSLAARSLRTFTTTVNDKLIDVTALPAPVAWAWALDAASVPKSFIAYEGAAALCEPSHYCLNALSFFSQSDFKNGYPAAILTTVSATRLTDVDWYPVSPSFSTDLMTTQEHCGSGHCVPDGLDLTIGATPIIHDAYQGVYSPTGKQMAYVRNVAGMAHIFVEYTGESIGSPVNLGKGTQPDWQPLPAAVLNGPEGR